MIDQDGDQATRTSIADPAYEYAWIAEAGEGYISARIYHPEDPWSDLWADEVRDDLGIPCGDPIPEGWEPIEQIRDGAAVYRHARRSPEEMDRDLLHRRDLIEKGAKG